MLAGGTRPGRTPRRYEQHRRASDGSSRPTNTCRKSSPLAANPVIAVPCAEAPAAQHDRRNQDKTALHEDAGQKAAGAVPHVAGDDRLPGQQSCSRAAAFVAAA